MKAIILGLFLFLFLQETPEQTIKMVAQAMKENDKPALRALIAPSIGEENRGYAADIVLMGQRIQPVLAKGQKKFGQDEFSEAMGMLGTMLGMMAKPVPFQQVAAEGQYTQDGDKATIAAEIKAEQGTKLVITLSFEKEGGAWYMLPIMPVSELKRFSTLVNDAVRKLDDAISQSEDKEVLAKTASEIAESFM